MTSHAIDEKLAAKRLFVIRIVVLSSIFVSLALVVTITLSVGVHKETTVVSVSSTRRSYPLIDG